MAQDPTQPGANPAGSEKPNMWRRMGHELRQELSQIKRDSDSDDFDDEANALAVGVIVLGLLIASFFLVRYLVKDKPIDPGYSQLEAIKRVEHLVLVRQHYETLIPVTRKGDQEDLKFLMRAPVEIDGYLDMNEVEFQLEPDSLVIVFLPAAKIDTPYLDLENTQVYAPGQSLLEAVGEGVRRESTTYRDAYDQIRTALIESRQHVKRQAFANGILGQTQQEGQRYLRNLINSLGYRVRFVVPTQLPAGTSDSTRLEIMWQQLQRLEGQVPMASEADRSSLLSNLSRVLR